MANDNEPEGTPPKAATPAQPTVAPKPTAQPAQTPTAAAGAGTPAPQTAGVPTEKGVSPTVATAAPAVRTENPFRVRRKQLEEQLKQQELDKSRHAAHAKSTTQAMLSELKDQEARFGQSGLSPLTPRGNLLLAGSIAAEYPDDHLRWVNESVPGRGELLRSMGYEPIPGQRRGGDLVLYKIPREKWASGEVAKQEQTDRTLRRATTQSRDDMVQEFQSFLDKHQINIDADKMISREV